MFATLTLHDLMIFYNLVFVFNFKRCIKTTFYHIKENNDASMRKALAIKPNMCLD